MYSIRTEALLARGTATFLNPIAPGADPWVVHHEGFYYWCLSERDLGVAVYRSRSLTCLGEKFIVWRAPATGPHSAQVWAPELHFLEGRWYIYVAASDGRNETHRMIVLESEGADPTAAFHCKAELFTGDAASGRQKNRWAIDGTVLEHAGRRYFLWSGWADEHDVQWLYIAAMTNPWTLAGERVRLCPNDEYRWERVGDSPRGRGLHEGPQVLQRAGKTFVVFSCSGSWEPTYKLGLLELSTGGDPLDPSSWSKHAEPVFQSSRPEVCGVGHCSFTQSPDGTEDWIVFHAKVSPAHGWARVIHAQRFRWDADGRPDFGSVLDRKRVVCPSGDVAGADATVTCKVEAIERVTVRRRAGEASGEPVPTT